LVLCCVPQDASSRLPSRIDNGPFAEVALSSFENLPKLGTYQIIDALVKDVIVARLAAAALQATTRVPV
jgi:hypothetical protein